VLSIVGSLVAPILSLAFGLVGTVTKLPIVGEILGCATDLKGLVGGLLGLVGGIVGGVIGGVL
jgi:hypothetical protein